MNNNTFDLLNVNLDGSHLLEAGAGTGKTYSLSFLYLRLLLEPIQSQSPLKVDEIVVATFTNAATAELKERIYARLCEAENILLQLAHKEEVIGDETLITYLSDLQKNTDSLTLQRRLRLAQAQFDHAHIYSINAFALHLLSEHSITLGQPAPKDILDDDTQLIKNIYLQLAHNNFAEFGDDAIAIGKTVADMSSDQLYGLLASMHNHYDKLKKAEHYFPDYQAAEQTFNEIAEQLCSHTDDLRTAVDLLHTAIENKWLSKTSYDTDSLSVYTDKLFNRESYQPSDEKFLQFFSAQQLEKKLLKAGKTAGIEFDNPVFTQFNQLIELSSIVNKAESAEQYQHLMTLLSVIRSHLDNEKAKQMALTHDDIVRIVANGADKLHLPFKAALLDEAQDTNKNQLEIFKKLFLQRGHSCFFVGDPKQAIYGFRGGDVYTYLAMQQQVQHRHILPKNYRSTQAVNDCINTLFADNPFARNTENTINYHQIASDKDNQLSDFDDKSLTLVTADGTSADSLAETAADYLAHLLHSNIHITDKDKRRPLQYGDIAVLVRSGSQAERMQQALAQRGITASYTGQNSVYSTDEAVLMYALITAISESKTRQIKSLMLSPLFDYDTDDVLDDKIVNQRRQDFWDYANLYQQRGFAVMFYRLMHDYRIGGRLLQLTDGKRRLSNWIQLFELLQSALQNQSLTLLGLSEWLLRKINQHDKESQLRLEDQN
ncbi:MAG: UvrD-helicase domain-containing protein, partial [Pasteurella sp.]|nr:UvrD-helicase domain-containing protein [Pasteurella sp.]